MFFSLTSRLSRPVLFKPHQIIVNEGLRVCLLIEDFHLRCSRVMGLFWMKTSHKHVVCLLKFALTYFFKPYQIIKNIGGLRICVLFGHVTKAFIVQELWDLIEIYHGRTARLFILHEKKHEKRIPQITSTLYLQY